MGVHTGGDRPRSPLKHPDVIAAIRKIASESTNRTFRPACLAMLRDRFHLVCTKGQLAGITWREGIAIDRGDGVTRETDGAAGLADAQRRSKDAEKHRAAYADHQAVLRASQPGPPPMLNWRMAPRKAAATEVTPRAAPVVTLRPSAPPVTAVPLPAAPVKALPQPEPPEPPAIAPAPRWPSLHRSSQCCTFPLGEPGTPSFRYCDEPSHPGRPYCKPHCQASYVGFRAEREESIISAA